MGGTADHGGEGEWVWVGNLVEQLEGVGEGEGNRDGGRENDLSERIGVGDEAGGDNLGVDLFEGAEGAAALPDSCTVALVARFSQHEENKNKGVVRVLRVKFMTSLRL